MDEPPTARPGAMRKRFNTLAAFTLCGGRAPLLCPPHAL